jgi:hypothetical protein
MTPVEVLSGNWGLDAGGTAFDFVNPTRNLISPHDRHLRFGGELHAVACIFEIFRVFPAIVAET